MITPERLRAIYDCLRHFPPFARWNLPPGELVRFRVTRHTDREGHYTRTIRGDDYKIAVSELKVGHFSSVVEVVAHEMIHLYQDITKTETPNTVHNSEFKRHSRNICRMFGWDYKKFV